MDMKGEINKGTKTLSKSTNNCEEKIVLTEPVRRKIPIIEPVARVPRVPIIEQVERKSLERNGGRVVPIGDKNLKLPPSKESKGKDVLVHTVDEG